MKKETIIREVPDLFAEGPTEMVGRNIKTNIWERFTWGEAHNTYVEYAPLTFKNKHLVGTNLDYTEVISENDTVVNTSKDDINKVISAIKDFNTNQMGACAIYSIMKYAQGINKTSFMLRDNSFSAIINIIPNEEVEKILNEALKENLL